MSFIKDIRVREFIVNIRINDICNRLLEDMNANKKSRMQFINIR